MKSGLRQKSTEIVVDYVQTGTRENAEPKLDTIRKADASANDSPLPIEAVEDDKAETFGLCTNIDALPIDQQEMA